MSCPECGGDLVNVTREGYPKEFHCYRCDYHGDGSSENQITLVLTGFQAKLLQSVIAHGKVHFNDTKELDEVEEKLSEYTGSSSLVFIIPRKGK